MRLFSLYEIKVTFLGALQRKLNARHISITFNDKDQDTSLRTLLIKILEKLPGEKERENFRSWVFNPSKPNFLNTEMAYILEGRHVRPTKEGLDMQIITGKELVIFPADGGG